MPNYIKNRIEILGSEKQVNKVTARFSTHFEREPHKANDGRLIYESKDTFGWLDEATGEFEERGKQKVKGIPDGFEQDFIEAWIRFPDFEKIISMPESLHVISGSNGDMGYSIMSGKSENCFMDMTEFFRRFYRMPMAERIDVVETGIIYAKNVMNYGHKTWYEWSIENWGTKWNSSDCKKVNENTFEFDTAWSGVPKLIELMSKEFPDIEINYEYSDEDTGNNCASYKFLNGKVIEKIEPEGGSKEAYELAFKLRPERAGDYKLVGDTYKYVDEE
ncbi:MAG: hypothetical protein WC389_16010 [Lutibacter sp.]|jgi:hypothetical protein